MHDVKKGTGEAARPHDTVLVDFITARYTSGFEYNRAWGGEPWPTAGVILTPAGNMRGFVKAITGMRVGGRRQIIVPRRLAGVDTGHIDFHQIVYWDVVLRGITGHGCIPEGGTCRSGF